MLLLDPLEQSQNVAHVAEERAAALLEAAHGADTVHGLPHDGLLREGLVRHLQVPLAHRQVGPRQQRRRRLLHRLLALTAVRA